MTENADILGESDGLPLILRYATERDAADMAAIDGDVDNLSLLLLLSTTKAFVVESNEVIGWAMVRKFERPSTSGESIPGGWYLTGLSVDPTVRRRGIGRALTSSRLKWLQGNTATVRYFTEKDNEASIALHRKFGFTPVREHLCKDTLIFGQGSGVLFEKHLNE